MRSCRASQWRWWKGPACHCRRRKRHGFDPWARKMPWRRAWQPPPVSLPGESHGQESLAGCSPRGRRLGHPEGARGARHGLPSSRALRRVLALLTVCPVSGTAHLGIGVCALGPRPHAASAGTTQPVLTHGDSESVPRLWVPSLGISEGSPMLPSSVSLPSPFTPESLVCLGFVLERAGRALPHYCPGGHCWPAALPVTGVSCGWSGRSCSSRRAHPAQDACAACLASVGGVVLPLSYVVVLTDLHTPPHAVLSRSDKAHVGKCVRRRG